MTESIAARIKRILSGDFGDLVDRMEASRAESVMKETVREVERIIDEARSEMGRASARRLQATRQAQMVRKKIEDLGDNARAAMKEGREDLAQAAVSRQLDLEAQLEGLAKAEQEAAGDESAMARDIAALSARMNDMRESLEAFAAARREAERDAPAGADAVKTPDRRVETSVAAFERAMKAAAGEIPTFAATKAETSAKLAELDVILRDRQIADRMTALKADVKLRFM
ncbi:PspA/IM30 family protein [Methylocystis parvus]|uniref:PspA/IM30 family protein n=1 Tax=Methylocystis parvus TaxID=134 RepID=A0A6B8M2D0_9HYPH|nr:PspA/IM30 family protein [Methylocystis parvus]QGM96475.1 hypothetical protein F7D14_02590 [Methylocystis parvus]WBJ99674.1 PspA/IM30 family protein [Methylocystis parvus OBBP]